MSRIRLLAFLMLVTQSLALCYLQTNYLLTGIAILSAAIGVAAGIRIVLHARLRFWGLTLATAIVLGMHFLRSLKEPDLDELPHVSLAFALGQLLVFTQVAIFFLKFPHDRLPRILPVLGVLTFLCAAITDAFGVLRTLFLLDCVVFALVSAMYLRAWTFHGRAAGEAGSGRVHLVSFIPFIATTVLAFTLNGVFQRFQEQIELGSAQLMRQVSRDESIGFSGGGGLSDISLPEKPTDKRVALRITSNARPGYMRGEAFARYGDGSWEIEDSDRALSPLSSVPKQLVAVAGGRIAYGIDNQARGEWRVFNCEPKGTTHGFVFTPLGTTHLFVESSGVDVTPDDVFRTFGASLKSNYVAALPVQRPSAILSASNRRRLTRVPRLLRTQLRLLAREVFHECETTRQKANAVERYFRDNFSYQLGIDVPSDMDPLLYFLTEKPPAHCEYFASAAALLLRMADVPTRYVTGYVVTERDDAAEHWIARNRDAHAWVEAYDEQDGWFVVEATPPAGVPPSQPPPLSALVARQIRSVAAAFMVFLQEDAVQWLSRSVLLIVTLVVLVVVWRFRHRLLPTRSTHEDPAFARYRKILSSMDRRLKRKGLKRKPHETLHDFAERIGTRYGDDPQLCLDAQWYRLYAEMRFGGEVTAEAIHWLLETRDCHYTGLKKSK